MELTIGGKEYKLAFGMKFIERLDHLYAQDLDGVKFGMGVESIVMYLKMENPTSLFFGIKAAAAHLKTKPSDEDIEVFITELAEKDKLSKLFKDFFSALEKAPLVQAKTKGQAPTK